MIGRREFITLMGGVTNGGARRTRLCRTDRCSARGCHVKTRRRSTSDKDYVT